MTRATSVLKKFDEATKNSDKRPSPTFWPTVVALRKILKSLS